MKLIKYNRNSIVNLDRVNSIKLKDFNKCFYIEFDFDKNIVSWEFDYANDRAKIYDLILKNYVVTIEP